MSSKHSRALTAVLIGLAAVLTIIVGTASSESPATHTAWCDQVLTEARDHYSALFSLSYTGSRDNFDQEQYEWAQALADESAGKYLTDHGYYERGCPAPGA